MNAPAESPLPPTLPTDLAAAHAMILAERQARIEAQAEALAAKAAASSTEVTIAHLQLMIERLKRELYGQRSERTGRLIDQMELQLEELEAKATEDELAAEAMWRQAWLPARVRGRPVRKPFPEYLPRERVVIAAPTLCPCCGSMKLSKLGEDVTETLEVVPRSWKVIQTVREKFTCRACETITQPPAPFHVTPRGFVGPNLLAMVLFEKFGQHQPLNRQSERYGRESIDLSVSTLADQVGAASVALAPLHELIARHVMAAQRLHADDTTVPILAKGKTDTGRIWTYVRDDRPFGGADPPAALYFASRDRRQEHPDAHLNGWRGILQADAYGGYNGLYDPGLFRARRHRGERAVQARRRARVTDRAGGRETHRRALRHRARDQRPERRRAPLRSTGAKPLAGRRPARLARRAARQTLALGDRRQADRLHA